MDNSNSSRFKFFKSIGLISPQLSNSHLPTSTHSEDTTEFTNKLTFRKKLRNFRENPKNDDTEKTENNNDVNTKFELNFNPIHSRDDFRLNYLRRLSYANVWVPSSKKPPTHQTVCIFDWDDTLLCTTFINCHNEASMEDPAIRAQLESIQKYGKSLLELAMTLGKLFIITNAREGWVQYSSRKYLPGLYPVLQKVTVISARKHFEEVYPGNFHEWKIRAFLSVKDNLNSQIITNLISVGDSDIEMDAVHVMGKEFSQALVKTIKFREEPYPNELSKQLELLFYKFERLCLHPKSLKIGLERKE